MSRRRPDLRAVHRRESMHVDWPAWRRSISVDVSRRGRSVSRQDVRGNRGRVEGARTAAEAPPAGPPSVARACASSVSRAVSSVVFSWSSLLIGSEHCARCQFAVCCRRPHVKKGRPDIRGGVSGRNQREDARRCSVARRPGSKSLQRWRSRRAHRALKSPKTIKITPISRRVPSVIRHPLPVVAARHLPRSPPCGSLLSF